MAELGLFTRLHCPTGANYLSFSQYSPFKSSVAHVIGDCKIQNYSKECFFDSFYCLYLMCFIIMASCIVYLIQKMWMEIYEMCSLR